MNGMSSTYDGPEYSVSVNPEPGGTAKGARTSAHELRAKLTEAKEKVSLKADLEVLQDICGVAAVTEDSRAHPPGRGRRGKRRGAVAAGPPGEWGQSNASAPVASANSRALPIPPESASELLRAKLQAAKDRASQQQVGAASDSGLSQSVQIGAEVQLRAKLQAAKERASQQQVGASSDLDLSQSVHVVGAEGQLHHPAGSEDYSSDSDYTLETYSTSSELADEAVDGNMPGGPPQDYVAWAGGAPRTDDHHGRRHQRSHESKRPPRQEDTAKILEMENRLWASFGAAPKSAARPTVVPLTGYAPIQDGGQVQHGSASQQGPSPPATRSKAPPPPPPSQNVNLGSPGGSAQIHVGNGTTLPHEPAPVPPWRAAASAAVHADTSTVQKKARKAKKSLPLSQSQNTGSSSQAAPMYEQVQDAMPENSTQAVPTMSTQASAQALADAFQWDAEDEEEVEHVEEAEPATAAVHPMAEPWPAEEWPAEEWPAEEWPQEEWPVEEWPAEELAAAVKEEWPAEEWQEEELPAAASAPLAPPRMTPMFQREKVEKTEKTEPALSAVWSFDWEGWQAQATETPPTQRPTAAKSRPQQKRPQAEGDNVYVRTPAEKGERLGPNVVKEETQPAEEPVMIDPYDSVMDDPYL